MRTKLASFPGPRRGGEKRLPRPLPVINAFVAHVIIAATDW